MYFNPTACVNFTCNKGSQCKVYEPTGRPYCEPSCDIDNGGCGIGQICSLRNVTCDSPPCPPEVVCGKLYCLVMCIKYSNRMHRDGIIMCIFLCI